MSVVDIGLRVDGQDLVVIDRGRRLYIGLSRDRTYWHAVMPITADDLRVQDGKRQAGQLTCTCIHGRIRGHCYRVNQAEAYEAAVADLAAGRTVPASDLESALA